MARLAPVNAARCPACEKKETQRVGYSETKKGSVWRCTSAGCEMIFVVPMLVLAKRVA